MLREALREPRGVTAVTLVALTVLLVAVRAQPGFEGVHASAARNEGFTPEQRLLVSAYGIDISREFLLAARRLLPRDATYAVATGPHVQVSTPITLSALSGYSQSLLLPRRQFPFYTADAEYLLCYGCDVAEQETAGPVDVLWNEEQGLVIARRRR